MGIINRTMMCMLLAFFLCLSRCCLQLCGLDFLRRGAEKNQGYEKRIQYFFQLNEDENTTRKRNDVISI